MKRILLLPGWGFRASVFDSLRQALGNEFEFDQAETLAACSGDTLPDSLLQQAVAADVLIGWSLGGLLALQLALQSSARGKPLVLLATTPCFTSRTDWDAGMPAAVFNDFRQLLDADPSAAIQQFIRLNSGARGKSESRRQLVNNTVEPHHGPLSWGLDKLSETDLRGYIASISSPMLIMQARDDRLVSAKAGHWLNSHAANARLIEFDDGGHAFFLLQPDRVAEAVRQWV